MVDLPSVTSGMGVGAINGAQKTNASPKANLKEIRDEITARVGNNNFRVSTFDPGDPNALSNIANVNRAGDLERTFTRPGQTALVVNASDKSDNFSLLTIIFDRATDADSFLAASASENSSQVILFSESIGDRVGRTRAGITQQAQLEMLGGKVINDLNNLDKKIRPSEIKTFSSDLDAAGYAKHQNNKGDEKRTNGSAGEVALVMRLEANGVIRHAVFTFESAANAAAFVGMLPKNHSFTHSMAINSKRTLDAGRSIEGLDDLADHELRNLLSIFSLNGVENLQSSLSIPIGLSLSETQLNDALGFLNAKNKDIKDRKEQWALVELSNGTNSIYGVVKNSQLEPIKGETEHPFQMSDYTFREISDYQAKPSN